jgi:hypothetical protein
MVAVAIVVGLFVFVVLPFVVGGPRDTDIDAPTEAIYVDTQRHEPRVRNSANKGRKGRYS